MAQTQLSNPFLVASDSYYVEPPDPGVELARSFLGDILQYERLAGFERLWLRVNDSNLAFSGFNRLTQAVAQARWNIGDLYYAPQAYLPRGRRYTENIVQINAICVDFDDCDADEAAERLAELGITPNWLVRTRPDRSQAVLKLPPWRLAPGKNPERAAQVRGRADRALKQLVDVVDADKGASSINSFFRLPGSRRQLDDGVWTVTAEHIRSQPTTLGELENVLSIHSKKAHKATPGAHTPKPQSPTPDTYMVRDRVAEGDALKTRHCQWLMERRVNIGHRGCATFKLAVAHRLDGIAEDHALSRMSDWRDQCTEPGKGGDGKPFTMSDIRAIVRGVYRRSEPWGIDWRSSADIQDVNGQRMGEATAKTIKTGMPNLERPSGFVAKPLDELQNQKAPQQLLKVLKYFAQRAQSDRSDTITTTQRQTADATGVPVDTLKRTIWHWLDNAGVKYTVSWQGVPGRARATCIQVPRLLQLAQQPRPAYGGILQFTPSHFYRLGSRGIVNYWLRRLRPVLDEIAALAQSALAQLETVLAGFTEGVVESEPCPVEVPPSAPGRDPPRPVGVAGERI